MKTVGDRRAARSRAEASGLLDLPGVVHEDDLGVVGEELSVHVGSPVAIGTYGHPVQARAGQVGFDPGSVQRCLADLPKLLRPERCTDGGFKRVGCPP